MSPSARVGAAVVLALLVGLAAPASAQYPNPREHWRYRTDEEVGRSRRTRRSGPSGGSLDRAVLIVLEACAEKKVNQPDVTEIRSWGAHYVAERERITAMVTDLEKKLGEKSRAEA